MQVQERKIKFTEFDWQVDVDDASKQWTVATVYLSETWFSVPGNFDNSRATVRIFCNSCSQEQENSATFAFI